MQIYKIETEENGRELTIHGTHDFPCASYDERFSEFFGGEVSWHWHDEIEIVLVVEGATKVECIDKSDIVHAGEMIFINANTLHKLTNHGPEDCRILNVVFNPKMLGGIHYGLIYKKHILPIIHNKALLFYKFTADVSWHNLAMKELADAFTTWELQREDREFCMNIALMKFWHLFCTNQASVLAPTQKQSTAKNNEARVHALLNFIHHHYDERISISDMSHAANISESECYRIFRHALKSTPNNYLLDYRLRQAMHLLTQSTKPIADIAYDTGFNCSAYFAKKFKLAFDETPNQFRKKFSNASPVS